MGEMNYVLDVAKLEEMLAMQAELNDKLDPGWRGLSRNYARAICAELAEAVFNHTGWEWWKKTEMNTSQIDLELVDVWHFALSDMLAFPDKYAVQLGRVCSPNWQPHMQRISQINGGFTLDDKLGNCLTRTLKEAALPLDVFALILEQRGMSWDDLYYKYIGKNVLNTFRKKNGYKEGTYVKIWDDEGHEDNEYLTIFMNSWKDLSEQADGLPPNWHGTTYPNFLWENLENVYAAVIDEKNELDCPQVTLLTLTDPEFIEEIKANAPAVDCTEGDGHVYSQVTRQPEELVKEVTSFADTVGTYEKPSTGQPEDEIDDAVPRSVWPPEQATHEIDAIAKVDIKAGQVLSADQFTPVRSGDGILVNMILLRIDEEDWSFHVNLYPKMEIVATGDLTPEKVYNKFQEMMKALVDKQVESQLSVHFDLVEAEQEVSDHEADAMNSLLEQGEEMSLDSLGYPPGPLA